VYDAFDQAMDYDPQDNIFMQPCQIPEGVAGISIKEKKKKVARYVDSVSDTAKTRKVLTNI
jgi:hypothetical protein